ncbi:MAG: TetR-like C-terminal domain-containing protein [Actinomycetota bacterium]
MEPPARVRAVRLAAVALASAGRGDLLALAGGQEGVRPSLDVQLRQPAVPGGGQPPVRPAQQVHLLTEIEQVVCECCEADSHNHPDEPSLDPATFQAMMTCWAILHGFTSLEAHGHLDWLPPEGRDALFRAGIRLAAITAGLPHPE